MPRAVSLRLRGRTWPIRIGDGVAAAIPRFLPGPRRAFVVCDAALPTARDAVLGGLANGGWEAHALPVEAGEALKTTAAVNALYGELLARRADRDSVLVAVGGGTVGDAAGFVAATYLRGIDWIGVPTTLLAQVDSAVGGKTAINHEAGKNLVGAFHQPALVVCDTALLATLPRRELVSGLGEVLKYGLVYDGLFLDWLAHRLEAFVALDPPTLARAIETSLRWKCRAVAKDELDRKGVREALNFGHTLGHALESATNYEGYRHGEAVVWGMRFALALSVVRGHMSPDVRPPLDALLARLDVPPLLDARDTLFEKTTRDKKVKDGRTRFVLLARPGHVVLDHEVGRDDLVAAWSLLTEGSDGR
jgi:3-dehydroquinate synthase